MSLPRGTRWLLGATLLISTGLIAVLPAGNAVAAPAVQCTDTASTETAAASLAAACKTPVEVSAQRTETSEVLANPNGSRTLRTYAQPQRARKADGSWAAVDATLSRAADGSYAPVASTVGLRFSGGGSGPLVSIDRAGQSIVLSWPTPLPAPTVQGTDATYAEVLHGVDLRVSATIDGFSQVLIVKDKAAAANPALRKVSMGYAAKGVSLRTTGSGAIEARDPRGNVVFASSGAFMWDSPAPAMVAARAKDRTQMRAAGVQAPASADEPEPPAHQSAMPVEVSSSAVSVTPAVSLLTGADTQFPLYIDPAFTGTAYKWTQTNKNSPNTSYWTSNRDYMRVGKEWQSANVWRTFLRFDNLQPLYGATITEAHVFVTLYHSGGCAATPVELWHTNFVDDIYTNSWSTTTGAWLGVLQSRDANANKGDCPQPNMVVEFANDNVKNEVQRLANTSTWHIDLGLKAPNESDDYQWKKFLPSGAHLDVTYNRYPNTPSAQGLSSTTDCYLQCASPALSRSVTPTLSAAVSDPDGGNMSAWFEVWNAAETTQVVAAPQVNVTSGNVAAWAVATGKLTPGTTYHWRVRAADEMGWFSGYSPWQILTVDTTAPTTPAAASAQFPAKAWGTPVGTAGTFELKSDDDVANFTWSVDGGSTTTVAANAGSAMDGWYNRGGDGHGGWQNGSTLASGLPLPAIGGLPEADSPLRLADFDGDGKTDYLVIRPDGSNYSAFLYRNNGGDSGAGWVSAGPVAGLLSPSLPVTRFADFDGDGKDDYLTLVGNKVNAWLNRGGDGAGGWVSLGPVATGLPASLADARFADFDGDGKDDYLIVDGAGTVQVFLNRGGDGRGGWTALGSVASGLPADHTRARFADFDGDGKADYLLLNGDGSTSVFLNRGGDGRGGWQAMGVLATGFPTPGETQFADFDGDHKADYLLQRRSGKGTRTATAAYTAATDMVHTLHVTAKDTAGNVSGGYDHQFWVTPSPNRNSHWTFDESTGTSAADSGSGGSSLAPLTLSGSAAFGPGYLGNGLVLNGGTATTASSVLDTTKSFTVMAWVNPSDLSAANGYETVISQDGVNMSRFVLRYDKDANNGAGGWCFGMRAADTVGSNPMYACATGTAGSTNPPAVGQWVHLAGLYNAVTGVIQIHVMGGGIESGCDGEMVETPFNSNWSATGKLAVGRAQTSGSGVNMWHGAIDDVYAFQRALGPTEICQQALQ